MHRGQWIVLGIFVVSVVAFVVYELYALVSGDASTRTISEYVWEASHRYAMIPFMIGWALGILCGHFFWQRTVELVKQALPQ